MSADCCREKGSPVVRARRAEQLRLTTTIGTRSTAHRRRHTLTLPLALCLPCENRALPFYDGSHSPLKVAFVNFIFSFLPVP